MNRLMSLAVVIVTLSGTANAREFPIIIESPRGGEMYQPGQAQTVVLDLKTRAKSILVELSRDGGNSFETVGTIDNTTKLRENRNRLTWTPTIPETNNAVIRCTSTDSRKPGTGSSGPFSILALGSGGGGSPDPHVLKAGDTMTGQLVLNGDPTQADGAATKNYVDTNLAGKADATALAGKVDKTGDTITGNLTLNGNLTVNGSVTQQAATRFYSVSHTQFNSSSPEAGGGVTYIDIQTTKMQVSISSPTLGGKVSAAVNLPHGAVITEFRLTLDNTDPSMTKTATLIKNSMSDGSATNIQALSTTATSGVVTLTGSALSEVVDNSAYTYFIRVSSGTNANFFLHNARIKYTVTTPLP